MKKILVTVVLGVAALAAAQDRCHRHSNPRRDPPQPRTGQPAAAQRRRRLSKTLPSTTLMWAPPSRRIPRQRSAAWKRF